MTSSRAALLLLCALAGVESFGYFDPGAISACTTATDWGSCAPTSGCYWDESTHSCMDDPNTIYNGNQVDCESAGGSYAETMAAAGICSSDPCMAYTHGDLESGTLCSVIGCLLYPTCTTCTPAYDLSDHYCAADPCSYYSHTDDATCTEDHQFSGLMYGGYCNWDPAGLDCWLGAR